MTVFKTFLKIVKKYKFTVILYTVILIVFAGFNMQTSENSTNFVASKPDILIINKDENIGLTKNLIEYIGKNSNIIEIENDEDAINDALFYREINYIIYIPENYRQNVLNKLNPDIEIKSTGDYQSSYAEMLLSRYTKIANIYINNTTENEENLINMINDTLSKEAEIKITSKLDTNNLERATFYYNFLNYSILAGCVYLICLILSSFKEEKIQKRTIISSMNYKKINTQLLISNGILVVILWVFYVLLSLVLIGNIMFTTHGLIYIINSFIFSMCSLTIALLIGNLINNKNAINGIVNVIALGSSFLCGAFVPMQWLPDTVLQIAHVLPSYYYISTNELLNGIETFNFETMKPILTNMGIILIFTLGFIILTNMVSKKKTKIG